MKELHTQKVALILGILLGGWHLLWSLFILAGIAQPLLDFIFWMHMIANPYRVTGFTVTQTVILILITFGVGYVVGFVFAWLWNTLHK